MKIKVEFDTIEMHYKNEFDNVYDFLQWLIDIGFEDMPHIPELEQYEEE
jgi:hypothetical protein